MSTVRTPAYTKNLGYRWLMFLKYCIFSAIVSVAGGLFLALLPIMTLFFTMSIRGPHERADNEGKTLIAGISLFGGLVFNLTLISLLVGFARGDWVWFYVFSSGYLGICVFLAFLLSLVLIALELNEREEYDTDENWYVSA
jgi:hypothetical protein